MDMGYSHFIENDTGARKDEMSFTKTHSSGWRWKSLDQSFRFQICSDYLVPQERCVANNHKPSAISRHRHLFLLTSPRARWEVLPIWTRIHWLGPRSLLGLWSTAGLAYFGWCYPGRPAPCTTWLLSHPACQPGLVLWEWQGSMVKNLSAPSWISTVILHVYLLIPLANTR